MFGAYLLGLVGYIRDIKLGVFSEELPTELAPSELFQSLARTFELQYSRLIEEDHTDYIFNFGEHRFTIT